MKLRWVSGDKKPQKVQYGGGKSATSTVTTFTKDDMCSKFPREDNCIHFILFCLVLILPWRVKSQ